MTIIVEHNAVDKNGHYVGGGYGGGGGGSWGGDDNTTSSSGNLYDKPAGPTKPTNTSSGSSGSSSGSSGSSSKNSDDAKRDAEKAEKKARDTIHGQFDTIKGGLNQLLGMLGGQQAASQGRFSTQRDYSRGQVVDSLNQAMGRFGGYENDIMTGQKNTLHDLSSDVRNAFQAGNIYLGAKGASNSSAAGMYSRGIQQAANRNRADVLNQTQGSLADLNIRRSEAQAAADSQYKAIDNWFNNAVADLEQQFNDKRQQIEMAKVTATADEQAALSAMDQELWRSAQNLYSQLAAQQDAYLSSVSNSINQGSSFGENFNIDTTDTYDDPTAAPLDSKIDIASGGAASVGDFGNIQNPYYKKKTNEYSNGFLPRA